MVPLTGGDSGCGDDQQPDGAELDVAAFPWAHSDTREPLSPYPQSWPHTLPGQKQARGRNCSSSPTEVLESSWEGARGGTLSHEGRPSPGTHREHGRPILEGAGEPRHPRVVRQAGVAVAGRQRRVQERLLRGVVRLRLVLLGLGQGCGRGRGGGIPAAELCEVTCDGRSQT